MSGDLKSIEIELKLALPGPAVEEEIVGFVRQNGYEVENLAPVRNVDIYLDTFDWSLLKKKIALRYRVANEAAMYTVKSLGAIEEGIAKRMELEVKLSTPVDNPASVPVKKIRKTIDEMIFPRKLLEKIRILTNRRPYRLVSPEGAEIELAFDASSFYLWGLQKSRSARKQYELEAEFIKGPEQALENLSAILLKRFNYPPSASSKYEAAMERLKVTLPSKTPPPKFKVSLDDRLDLAVRKILGYQFQRFREYLPGVSRDIDTEFGHQARVATRRMRSAMRLFRDAIPAGTVAYLAEEVKWLGGLLGTVRDLDVFLLNLSRFREQIEFFPPKKRAAFENWIEKHRRAPFKVLCQAIDSPRYRTFERRFIQFLEKPLPLHPRSPLALERVEKMAAALITEKFERVIEQGKAVLANPKLKQFHRLRIQMKRLRYACEFIAPAYDDALDPVIERTVEIQDCLGELQDTVFTRTFIDSLRDDWNGKLVDPDLLFILGEIYHLQGDIERARKGAFGKIWERFSSEDTIRLLEETLFGKLTAEQSGPQS